MPGDVCHWPCSSKTNHGACGAVGLLCDVLTMFLRDLLLQVDPNLSLSIHAEWQRQHPPMALQQALSHMLLWVVSQQHHGRAAASSAPSAALHDDASGWVVETTVDANQQPQQHSHSWEGAASHGVDDGNGGGDDGSSCGCQQSRHAVPAS